MAGYNYAEEDKGEKILCARASLTFQDDFPKYMYKCRRDKKRLFLLNILNKFV